MAVFDDTAPKNKLLIYDHVIEWIDRVPVPHKQEATPIEFSTAEPLNLECMHFLECLESRQEPRTNGVSGLKVLKVLDACQRSLQTEGENIIMNVGNRYFVHPTSIVEEPSTIREGTKIWHFSHIMPHTSIGKNCTIGQNVFIGENVSIGDSVRIQNNVSVFDGVTLEDEVFCGPSCVFTNVKSPRSSIAQRGSFIPTLVKKSATIGANATIICGNTIGKYALIGAGSVVTSDIPDYALAYGNPARINGWVCDCGTKIDFEETNKGRCSQCGNQYIRHETDGKVVVKRSSP
jgi:UDP-2-acetamido-3-amino-2,3-dideoxy-glucuronate N-acetyltransferase